MNASARRLSYGVAIGGLYAPFVGLLPQLMAMPGLSGRQAVLLSRSLGYALFVAVIATLLGFLAALELWRWSGRARRVARRSLLLLLALPPYFHAAAWQPLVESWGSWTAAVVCQTLAVLPLAVAMGWLTLTCAAGPWLEAGWQMRSPGEALRRVVLPRCRLGLAACMGLLAVLTATDDAIPSLCGVATFAEEVFAQYSAGAAITMALAAAWPLALLTALSFGPLARQAAGAQGIPGSQVASRLPRWPWPVELACGLGLAILALDFLVPLRRHLVTIGSWSACLAGWSACWESLLTTLLVGAGAALIGTAIGLGLMEALASATRRRGMVVWELALLPLGLPPALLGIGLIDSLNRAWQSPLYGTVMMPMLASGLRYAPVAAVCLAMARRRLDHAVLEAGRLAGRGGLRDWCGLELALLRPAIGAAAALVFALSLGELGATLLVVPPGMGTLALRLFGLLHYGASAEASAGCLLLWLALLPLLWLVDRLFPRESRWRPA